MSAKATGLVWDMPCPQTINEIEFKPGHKFVLVAYADHADHHGKNIYPAIATIARKTGYEPRSVQRLTHELNRMGALLPDGQGPRGTNKWFIPFSAGGDKISPLTKFQGDESDKSLGDIPSGDIPSGDILTPEFKEPEIGNYYINNKYIDIWGGVKTKLEDEMPRASFLTWVENTTVIHFDINDSVLWIAVTNDHQKKWLTDRLAQTIQKETGLYIRFMVVHELQEA